MARREKKFHYIYKTTNLLSGRYYIGMHSTDNLEDGYMGSGTRLKRSLNKHGKENHKVEFIEFLDTRKELKDRETEIVNLNEVAKEDCMNLKVGGEGGFSSEEQRKNFHSAGGRKVFQLLSSRHANRLKTDPNYREYWLASLKPYDWTGRKHSEETKEKMSESSKGMGTGKTNSQYGTCWVTRDGLNKKIKKDNLSEFIDDGWIRGRK